MLTFRDREDYPVDADTLRAIQTLEVAANALTRTAMAEGGDAADALGRVRAVETNLAEYRRSLLAEETEAQGEAYAIVTENKTTRSYNDAAILASTINAGYGVPQLVREGVVKLQWQWQKLEKFFATHDLTLRVRGHEVANDGDVDGAHVGVIYDPYTRVIARERGD